ncbi:ankyrin repeat-containing protein [Gossypium australe]|uniref:Ankyrin repeat-containing protein n=1 Tax=Gossypium australe TaxID=47621 RepID=A0A5B6WBW7_9ROSI|nr:ankyrin repeat-containing protein [Gossypium australe]
MEKEIIISKPDMNRFNEMSEPYKKVLANDVHGLKAIYSKNPDALLNLITARKDTIFHIAAYGGHEEVLRVLLEMVPQSKKAEVLKVKNIYGNTILHEVATTTHVKAARLLMEEVVLVLPGNDRQREEILGARNKLGETPLFRAAEYSSKTMVEYLATAIGRTGNLESHYRRNDGTSILHIAVIGQQFDTAIWFLGKSPELATYKDKNGNTSLHLLASMASAFKSSSPTKGIFKEFIYYCLPSDSRNKEGTNEHTKDRQNRDIEQGEHNRGLNQQDYCKGWNMIVQIWKQKKMHESAVKLAKLLVEKDTSWLETHEPEEDDTILMERKKEKKEEMSKSNATANTERSPEPDTPLLLATKTGIVEIVNAILTRYPQAVHHIGKNGQNILHVAIMHRQYKVFNVVKKKEEAKTLVRGIDNHGCTILHYAANTKYYHGGTKPTPALKLQQELTWFEDVKNQMPSHFIMHLNKKETTADNLFKDNHRDLLKTAQEWVKNTSQSCSTVAILVATVVFTAAYTAPGGFLQNGRPILLDEPLYSFFTVMDVAGLASSLTSVVIFLSILTASLEFEDFHHRLPRNLSLGFTFLFFSVTSTMMTFTATILLLVHLEKKWTATLTYAAAFLPICLFALFQFPLYYQYFVAAVKSILDFLRRNLPGNWDFLQFIDDY